MFELCIYCIYCIEFPSTTRMYCTNMYNVQSKQEMMQEISVASYLIILPNLSPALAQARAPASHEHGYTQTG